jgi:lipopolysaccharide/colanic/teichoic acid biosynthesis glycosyltransferase
MHGEFSNKNKREVFEELGRLDLIKRMEAGETQFEDDPRVGRFGRFLRRTSIDELPQLWNVLKGDISLVGPRVIVKNELADYQKLAPLRQTVRSGITGLAQVSGRSELPFEQRLELDIYYVQNWSFWLDIVIIARTFAAIFVRNGVR